MNTLVKENTDILDFNMLISILQNEESAKEILREFIIELKKRSLLLNSAWEKRNWKEFKYLIEGIYESALYGMKRLERISYQLYKADFNEDANTINNTLFIELNNTLKLSVDAAELELKQSL